MRCPKTGNGAGETGNGNKIIPKKGDLLSFSSFLLFLAPYLSGPSLSGFDTRLVTLWPFMGQGKYKYIQLRITRTIHASEYVYRVSKSTKSLSHLSGLNQQLPWESLFGKLVIVSRSEKGASKLSKK